MAIKATPFWWVLSEGMGVTSSICPIFVPEQADFWGLIETPAQESWSSLLPWPGVWCGQPWCPALWPRGYIPGSQHSSICRRFISAGLHLHPTSYTGDGFLARRVSDMDRSVTEGCTDVQYHIHALSSHLRAKLEGENGLLFLLPFPLWSIISTHLFQTLSPESCNLFFKHYLSGLDIFYFTVLKIKTGKGVHQTFTNDFISVLESCHKSLFIDHAIGLRATYDAWKTPSFSFTIICFSTESPKDNSLVVSDTMYWFFSYFTHMGYSFSRIIYSPSLLFHYIFKGLDPPTILDTSNFNSGTSNLGLSDLHHPGVAAASGIFRNLSLRYVL